MQQALHESRGKAFVGVYPHRATLRDGSIGETGKWDAHISSNGRRYYLGTYENQREAGMAYDRAAIVRDLGKADTNYPLSGYKEWFTGAVQLTKLQREEMVSEMAKKPGTIPPFPEPLKQEGVSRWRTMEVGATPMAPFVIPKPTYMPPPKKPKPYTPELLMEGPLVPITLDLEVSNVKLKDKFLWNSSEPDSNMAKFANELVRDLGIPQFMEGHILTAMRIQVRDFRKQRQAMGVAGIVEDNEDLQLIRISVRVGNVQLQDQFVWDVNSRDADPEEFAASMCRDLGLEGGAPGDEEDELPPAGRPPMEGDAKEWRSLIAHAIRAEVEAVKRRGRGKRLAEWDAKRQRLTKPNFWEREQPSGQNPIEGLSSGELRVKPVNKTGVGRKAHEWEYWEPRIRKLTKEQVRNMEEAENEFAREVQAAVAAEGMAAAGLSPAQMREHLQGAPTPKVYTGAKRGRPRKVRPDEGRPAPVPQGLSPSQHAVIQQQLLAAGRGLPPGAIGGAAGARAGLAGLLAQQGGLPPGGHLLPTMEIREVPRVGLAQQQAQQAMGGVQFQPPR